MICPNCNSEYADGKKFCPKCGIKLGDFKAETKEEKTSHRDLDIVDGISEKVEGNTESIDLSESFHTGELDFNSEDETTEEKEGPFKDYEQESLKPGRTFSKKSLNEKKLREKEREEALKEKLKERERKEKLEKKENKKKMRPAVKVLLLLLSAILCVVLSVVLTLKIKESQMTKRFNAYYDSGMRYYNSENYNEARTQFINASNQAFTKEQKVKAYSMVYNSDEFIGGYDEEEINFLEALIRVDNSDVQYFKDLIVLYQNNDQENKISSLINLAPEKMKEELRNFDGTIPVPSLKEGSYDKPIDITLTAANNVEIFYSTDGSDPSNMSSAKKYEGPIKFENEGVYLLRAISLDSNNRQSKQLSAKYTIDFSKVEAPKINLASGKYEDQAKIEVTAAKDCTVYYTTDGTVPTENSTKYKEPIKLDMGDSLYYFIAINKEGVKSDVVTRAFDYVPGYDISFNSALGSLKDYLKSDGRMENSDGVYGDGSYAYFSYLKIITVDEKDYYLIEFEKNSKDGGVSDSQNFAVSADNGSVHTVSGSGSDYKIN